jgi:hypothetical protein
MLKEVIWPWPGTGNVRKANVSNLASEAMSNKFILPVIGLVDMEKWIDWSIEFPAANKSARMWLHSLPFVHYLVEEYCQSGDEKFWKHASYLYTDYSSWQISTKINEKISWVDEHTVANRTCVISAMLFAMQKSEIDNRLLWDDLLAALIAHGKYLCNPNNYVLNNHGVMMDQMLLQASIIIKDYHPDLATFWRETAAKRLNQMLALTFDEHGCCTENSPMYHLINLNLFINILDFCNKNGLSEITINIDKAQLVAPIFLRQDRSLPMIGDSAGGPSDLLPVEALEKRFGVGFFPTSGLVIINDIKLHMTVKCGGSTYNHRHVDDTSIVANYGDHDFIVDAGMYNYQSADEMRQWITSYRAHSGFFVEACGNVDFPYKDRTKTTLPPAQTIARIVDYGRNGDLIFAAVESYLVPDVLIQRDIQVALPNIIILRDRMRADMPQVFRQQFLLHPSCKLTIRNNSAVIHHGHLGCEIIQHASEPLLCTEEDAWYSERFMELKETKSLVFSGEASCVELVTTIRFFGGNDKEYLNVVLDGVNFHLLRSLPYTLKVPSRQHIINSWISSSPLITPVIESRKSFACQLLDQHGYLVSHGAGFENNSSGISGALPSGYHFVDIKLRLDLISCVFSSNGAHVHIFFMQYLDGGERIKNDKMNFVLMHTENILSFKFPIEKMASHYKIALRLSGYEGECVVQSFSVDF